MLRMDSRRSMLLRGMEMILRLPVTMSVPCGGWYLILEAVDSGPANLQKPLPSNINGSWRSGTIRSQPDSTVRKQPPSGPYTTMYQNIHYLPRPRQLYLPCWSFFVEAPDDLPQPACVGLKP